MKTKLLFFLAAVLATGGSLFAQSGQQGVASNPLGGDITATSTDCSTVQSCVWMRLPSNAGTATVTLAGTFTQTLLVQLSGDGGNTWSLANTLSAAGITSYSVNGYTDIRVRASAFTSGRANVTINVGLQQVQSGSGSGSTAAPAVQSGVVHLDPTCPTSPAGGTNGTCYFWNADVRVYIDATTTNGSNILTISGSDKAFTSTETLNNGTTRPWVKVGQPIFCTNGPLNPSVPVVLANTTVLSIDSATQIRTTGNAASNQTATAYCYVGDDDTANILAFWTALLTNCGNFSAANGYLSSGIAFTTKGQFNTFTTACSNAFNAQYTEPALYGAGEALTTIMPLGNQFDFTTGAGNSCQGGGQITFGVTPPSGARTLCFGDFFSEFSFINIWGGGYTTTSAFGFPVGLFGANARLNSDNFQGWMAKVPVGSFIVYGVILNGNQVRFAQGCACYFGEYALTMNAQAYQIGNFAQGGIFSLVTTNGSGGVQPSTSYTSFIGPSNGSNQGCTVIVSSNSQLNEIGDAIFGATGSIAAHCVQANATGRVYGSTMSMSGTGGTLFSGLGAGAITQIQNNVITGNATATMVNMASGAVLDDQGGNNFTTFSTGFTGAGSIARTDSATGNPCAVGNFATTSGWGTTTITTASGNSHKCRMTFHTTVTGTASPVATWTFPQSYPLVAPSSCSLIQVGGTFGTLTNPVPGTPTTSSVATTFAGTPTATNDYIFEWNCGP